MIRIVIRIIPFLIVFFVINFLGCQLIKKVSHKNTEKKNYELQFQLTDLLIPTGLLEITLTNHKNNSDSIAYIFSIANKSSLTLEISNIIIYYYGLIGSSDSPLKTLKFAVEENIMPNSRSSLNYYHGNIFKDYSDLSNQRIVFIDSIKIVGFNKEIYEKTKEYIIEIIGNKNFPFLANQSRIDKEYIYDLKERIDELRNWKKLRLSSFGAMILIAMIIIDIIYIVFSMAIYDVVYTPKIRNDPKAPSFKDGTKEFQTFQEAEAELIKLSKILKRLPSSLREKFEKRELPWEDLTDAIENTGFTIEEAAALTSEELVPIILYIEEKLSRR